MSAELLKDQVALVTGGTSGIGLAIVKKFLEHGAYVVFVGSQKEKGERAYATLLTTFPETHMRFMQVDVSKTDQVEAALHDVVKNFGKIDVLVNNAGVTKDQLLMKMTESDWDDVMDINAKSCFSTCRACVRPMLKARKGKIINIASIVGLIGNPGQTNYAASKGAIMAFSKSLALELASRNILVNCIAPGFIETKMTDALTEDQRNAILSKVPLGRMGNVGNVADAALFLASSLSDYITGQVLTVDGGLVR